MEAKYTLRYSGGMVPDIHHILTKGGGIFCNPRSPSAKVASTFHGGSPLQLRQESNQSVGAGQAAAAL